MSFTESVALSNLFIGNIGTGDVSGFNVSADTCRVTIDGTGDVEVTARDVLIVDRRGTGSLFYRGSPEIEIIRDEGTGEIVDAN